MALPFGLSLPQVIVGSLAVVIGAAKFLGPKVLGLWHKSRRDRRNRVREWHREMQRHLSKVRSVGLRLQTGRRVDVKETEGLVPTAFEMESKVNPEPVGVKALVEDDVRGSVRQAVGLVYHFTHLPRPEEDENSVAGVMRHQYEILQEIDSDTNVALDDVLEIVGGFKQFDGLEIPEEEAEKVLEDFEGKSLQRLENAEDMTVDELMELPWEIVDDVVTPETRRKMVEYAIEQYYEICLLEKPQRAKRALEDSEELLFG